MTELSSEQQFRIDIAGTLGKILERLKSIDDTNKKQDETFKEYRQTVKQALKEHREEVEKTFSEVRETIKVIVSEQKNLRSYIDRAIGALVILSIIVPIGLTALEVSTLFPSKSVTTETETGTV